MLRVRFEPTILVFERVKTVHALDRAATVTSRTMVYTKDNIDADGYCSVLVTSSG
jgi:hypothetical protein